MEKKLCLLSEALGLSSSDAKEMIDSGLNAQELIFSDSDYLKECLKLDEVLISKLSALKHLFEEISFEELQERFVIKEPKYVVKYLKTILRTLLVEHFVAIFLNNGNAVVDRIEVCGKYDEVQPDFRLILKRALVSESAGIICAHNHPGGNAKPSPQDVKLTSDLKKNVGNFRY